MNQPDLICANCPLLDCDESSLYCIYRFITDPNKAQRKAAFKDVPEGKLLPQHDRREYFKARYRANREKLLAAMKLRYKEKARMRGERV
jgi:hypothetical protein